MNAPHNSTKFHVHSSRELEHQQPISFIKPCPQPRGARVLMINIPEQAQLWQPKTLLPPLVHPSLLPGITAPIHSTGCHFNPLMKVGSYHDSHSFFTGKLHHNFPAVNCWGWSSCTWSFLHWLATPARGGAHV